MDHLLAIRTFLRVAELASFARAAESLGASRARVSELVAELEQQLAARLLHRTTRHVSLTDDGRVYYESCRQIVADLAEAEALLARASRGPRGRVRIAMPMALARLFFVPALPRLLEQYPELELELKLENRSVELLQEGVDCAISYGEPSDQELVARRLGSTRLLTCAAPSYLARHPRIRKPTDLERHKCIAFLALASGRPAAWSFARRGERCSHLPRGNLAFNSMEACVDAAAAGLGVTQVLSSLSHAAVLAGTLVPVLLDWAVPGPPLYIVYPPNRKLSSRLRAVIDFACELFAAQGDGKRPLGRA
ncbi:MAG TPA: LysR family transcriptional regulator [Polyangiaceae bacterium]|nr:LysR family transcriptional regulator [Polyangiaceae bacterium]